MKCHAGIKNQLAKGKVQHDAVTHGQEVLELPQPARLERREAPHRAALRPLRELPRRWTACCRGDGKPMTNYKKWLDENKVWHAPGQGQGLLRLPPHARRRQLPPARRRLPGRLLRAVRPEELRALLRLPQRQGGLVGGDDDAHRLPRRLAQPPLRPREQGSAAAPAAPATRSTRRSRTTTSARACPYGSKGWVLKVGYTKLPNGGSCAKTCHDTKTYNNKTLTARSPRAGSERGEPPQRAYDRRGRRSRPGGGGGRGPGPRLGRGTSGACRSAIPSRTWSSRPSTGARSTSSRRALAANVFVFFRPEQERSLDTLKDMAACEKEFEGKPVRWVGDRLRRVARRGREGVREGRGHPDAGARRRGGRALREARGPAAPGHRDGGPRREARRLRAVPADQLLRARSGCG